MHARYIAVLVTLLTACAAPAAASAATHPGTMQPSSYVKGAATAHASTVPGIHIGTAVHATGRGDHISPVTFETRKNLASNALYENGRSIAHTATHTSAWLQLHACDVLWPYGAGYFAQAGLPLAGCGGWGAGAWFNGMYHTTIGYSNVAYGTCTGGTRMLWINVVESDNGNVGITGSSVSTC